LFSSFDTLIYPQHSTGENSKSDKKYYLCRSKLGMRRIRISILLKQEFWKILPVKNLSEPTFAAN
jgi:hypothetical protein